MPFYKFAVQAFFLSLVIAGLWLWDADPPLKLICFGLLGMLVVVTQEELPYFFDNTLARLSGIDIRLRIIERSLELHRIEPESTESASTAINEELESQHRVRTLWEKITPVSLYDLFALAMLFILSSCLAWFWIVIFDYSDS